LLDVLLDLVSTYCRGDVLFFPVNLVMYVVCNAVIRKLDYVVCTVLTRKIVDTFACVGA
jgi:hypothetical protein